VPDRRTVWTSIDRQVHSRSALVAGSRSINGRFVRTLRVIVAIENVQRALVIMGLLAILAQGTAFGNRRVWSGMSIGIRVLE
jgi:hypothetical protein